MLHDLQRRARVVLRRRGAYRDLLLTGTGGDLSTPAEIVLADLRRACCADRPTTVSDLTGRTDPIATARNEGKREVWLRIIQALYLPDERIFRMLDAAEIEE